MQIQPALDRASRKLAADALKLWQGSVSRRTGRMRKSLRFTVRRVSSGVEVAFYVSKAGFYYIFQKDARQWTAGVERFLITNGKLYVLREIRALLGQ